MTARKQSAGAERSYSLEGWSRDSGSQESSKHPVQWLWSDKRLHEEKAKKRAAPTEEIGPSTRRTERVRERYSEVRSRTNKDKTRPVFRLLQGTGTQYTDVKAGWS